MGWAIKGTSKHTHTFNNKTILTFGHMKNASNKLSHTTCSPNRLENRHIIKLYTPLVHLITYRLSFPDSYISTCLIPPPHCQQTTSRDTKLTQRLHIIYTTLTHHLHNAYTTSTQRQFKTDVSQREDLSHTVYLKIITKS